MSVAVELTSERMRVINASVLGAIFLRLGGRSEAESGHDASPLCSGHDEDCAGERESTLFLLVPACTVAASCLTTLSTILPKSNSNRSSRSRSLSSV